MILVGEAHPELPLESMISSLNLSAHVRHIGFAPIEDFNGYLGACDIVLNLRYPTVGESRHAAARAGNGQGRDRFRRRIVPRISGRNLPESSGGRERRRSSVRVSEPAGLAAGGRAGAGRAGPQVGGARVQLESVAERYAEFLEGKSSPEPRNRQSRRRLRSRCRSSTSPTGLRPKTERARTSRRIRRGSKKRWRSRLRAASDRVLEMGAYLQITPALHSKLGYGEVRGCYFGPAGETKQRTVTSETGETFACEIDLFNAEQIRFRIANEHFKTVLCCELLEHLPNDPMHMMTEINRVLKPGGHLVLTTPNIASAAVDRRDFARLSSAAVHHLSFAPRTARRTRAIIANTPPGNTAAA